jgi:hypothetical protein
MRWTVVLVGLGLVATAAPAPLAGAGAWAPVDEVVVLQSNVTGYAAAMALVPSGGTVLAGAIPGEVVEAFDRVHEVVPATAYLAAYEGDGKARWFHAPDFGARDGFTDVALDPGGSAWAAGLTSGSGAARWAWVHRVSPMGALDLALNLSALAFPTAEAAEAAAVLPDPDPSRGVLVAGTARYRDSANGAVQDLPYLVRVHPDGSLDAPRFVHDLGGMRVADAVAGPAPGQVYLAGTVGWVNQGCVALADAVQGTMAWRACGANGIQSHDSAAVSGGALFAGGRAGTNNQMKAITTRHGSQDGTASWTGAYGAGAPYGGYAVAGLAALPDGGVLATLVNLTAVPLLPPDRFLAALLAGDTGGSMASLHLRYGPDGTLLGVRDLREHGQVAAFDNAVDEAGFAHLAGFQADAASQRYHPVVLRGPAP